MIWSLHCAKILQKLCRGLLKTFWYGILCRNIAIIFHKWIWFERELINLWNGIIPYMTICILWPWQLPCFCLWVSNEYILGSKIFVFRACFYQSYRIKILEACFFIANLVGIQEKSKSGKICHIFILLATPAYSLAHECLLGFG